VFGFFQINEENWNDKIYIYFFIYK
jgi:hypothetical protein